MANDVRSNMPQYIHGCRILSFAAAFICMLPLAVSARPLKSGPFSIRADGTVFWSTQSIGKLTLPPTPHRFIVAHHTIEQHRLTRLSVVGKEGRTADLIIEGTPPHTETVYNGTAGPQGVDGEWHRQLKLTKSAIIIAETRVGWQLCGESTDRQLRLRRYDFSLKRFVRAPNAAFPADLVTIHTQTRAPLPLTKFRQSLNSFRVESGTPSSKLPDDLDIILPPIEVGDGDLQSAWRPHGLFSNHDRFVTFRRLSARYPLFGVAIVQSPLARSTRSPTKKTAVITLENSKRFRVQLPPTTHSDTPTVAWIRFPAPVATQCFSVVVEAVGASTEAMKTPSAKAAQSSPNIVEVRPITTLELQPNPVATLISDLLHADSTVRNTAIALLARRPRQAIKQLEPLISRVSAQNLSTLFAAVNAIHSSKTAALLAQLLRRAPVDQAPEIIAALLDKKRGTSPLVQLFQEGPPALKPAIAEAFGKANVLAAAPALVSATGTGSASLRRAIVEALARLARKNGSLCPTLLTAALVTTTINSRRADLIAALGRGCKLQPKPWRTNAVKHLTAIEKMAVDFEVALQWIAATARLEPQSAKTLLRSSFRDPDPIIRWKSIQRLARNPTAKDTEIFVKALRDPDPRIRTAAAAALRQTQTERPNVANALAKALSNEHWPDPAASIAFALGRHCQANAVSALKRVIRPAAPADVTEAALAALRQCMKQSYFAYSVQIARNHDLPASLRARALAQLDPVLTKKKRTQLISLFEYLRRAATSEDDLDIAATCAVALGTCRHEAAAAALRNSVANDQRTAIRVGATRALHGYCDKKTIHSLSLAKAADPSPVVKRLAEEAMRACLSNTK